MVTQGTAYKKMPIHKGKIIGTTKNKKYSIERIRVYVEKISLSNDQPGSIIKEVVNLGAYFPYIRQTNFFVDVDDYAKFAQTYPPSSSSYARLKRDLYENLDSSFNIYALSYPHPQTQESFVQPITNYRVGTNGTGGHKIHFEIGDIYCPTVRAEIRASNINILRIMQNGDDNHEIMCRITGINLENFAIAWSASDIAVGPVFDMHHLLVEDNISVRRKGKYLANRLGDIDLVNSIAHLVDLMGTISLSKSTHAMVHYNCPTQGIERYRSQWLPWVLQNNSNFDSFCQAYGLDLNFDQFIYYHSMASLSDDNFTWVPLEIEV
jgi:hypothetical protein